MPRVSVVIPAYNAARWIADTLGSVLAQSWQDYEIIVVDDGSIDDTAAIIQCFDRVRYIYKPNGGQASARNVGIRASRGENIALLDADDLWLPEKLNLQMALLNQTGLMWVYCDACAFDDATKETLYVFSGIAHLHDGDILQPLLMGDFIPSPTPIIARRVFDELGYFDESLNLRQREDWDMWLRIAARYPIGFVNHQLAWYRVSELSSTHQESIDWAFQSRREVIERAFAREPERLTSLGNRVRAQLRIAEGRAWIGVGSIPKARDMFRDAIQLAPRNLPSYLYWLGTWAGTSLISKYIRVLHWFRRGRGAGWQVNKR